MTTSPDDVEKTIEYEIIFGDLRPGEKLREINIASRLDASRHHVRLALTNLEKAGIVVREKNKSARVREYSEWEVRKLYDVREMLTRQAALNIALPAQTEAMSSVEAAQIRYEDAVATHDLRAIHEANDSFHAAVFHLCENPYLEQLLKRCMDMTYVIRAANMSDRTRLQQACAEHRTIMSLLNGTDPWALSELCVLHLRPSRDAYLARIKHATRQKGDKPYL